jgi:purine-binding chemotaxis protein CheW
MPDNQDDRASNGRDPLSVSEGSSGTAPLAQADYERIVRAVLAQLMRDAPESIGPDEVVEAVKAVGATRSLSAEREQEILQARAEALARVSEEEDRETVQLVVFSLANETYGVATLYVREVQTLGDVSPVPCTPSFVVGIINIRGAIYSVVDISELLGLPPREMTDTTKVLLVAAAGLEVGIVADDVLGESSIPLADIKPPLATRAGVKEEYVQGVTQEMLSILNLEALMADERMVVHEEVG